MGKEKELIQKAYHDFILTDLKDHIEKTDREVLLGLGHKESLVHILEYVLHNRIGHSWVEFEQVLDEAFTRGYMAGMSRGRRR